MNYETILTINYLLTPALISFLVTLLIIPFWIKKSKAIGLLWDDVQKLSKEKIPGSGGLTVLFGFIIGTLIFIAFRTFVLKTNSNLVEMFALLTVILIAAGIGFVDDLLGWRKGGLSMKYRILVLIFAAIPLMAINAGRAEIGIPFIGSTSIGLLYPLLFIPLGIVGATTTFNFLAGYNGLEAGQGVIQLSSLALVAYLTGNTWLSIIALCMIASLLAFLRFNFYPARLFAGDILTYPVGALIATMAILGNFERIAVFFFIPFILETCLKLRGNLKKHSFGKINKDGSLSLAYDKIYGLEHLSIYLMEKLNIKPTEKRVVYSLWAFEIAIIIVGFIIFREGIF